MKFNKKVFSIFGGILVAMALFALGANSEPLHYVLTVIDGICGQNVNFSGTVKFKGITTQAFSYENALTLDDAALLKHMHSNKTLLDTYTQSEANLADAVSQKHGHTNKTLLDTYTQSEANLADAVSQKHGHTNKTLLDTYSQTNADLADSVSKKHAHSNSTVLDKFSEAGGAVQYNGSPIGGGGESAPVTLGTSGSQPIDFAVSKKYSITPTAAVTFTTPNAADMDSVELAIVNGGTKITFPLAWEWGNNTSPVLQLSGVDKIKLSAYTYNSTTKIHAERIWYYNAAPFDQANLGFWINPSTVTLNNNDPIESLTDSSGNGVVIGQSDPASRPTWKTNVAGTIGAMYFDTDKYLKISSYATNASCAFVVVLYQNYKSPNAYYCPIFSNASATGWSSIYTDHAGAIGRYAYAGSPQYEDSSATIASPSPMTILMFNFDAIAGSWTVYKNGVLQGSAVGYTGMYNDTPVDFYLNKDNSYGGSTYGYIFDVMHFKAKLSADQITSVNNYLKTKYGL